MIMCKAVAKARYKRTISSSPTATFCYTQGGGGSSGSGTICDAWTDNEQEQAGERVQSCAVRQDRSRCRWLGVGDVNYQASARAFARIREKDGPYP